MFGFIKRIERLSALVGLVILVIALLVGMVMRFLPKSAPQVIAQKLEETNATKHYILDVQYPEIINFSAGVSFVINTKIKQIVSGTITNFKNEAASTGLKEQKIPFPSSLTIRFEAVQVTPKVVSILFSVSDFPSGAAHSFITTSIYNYSVVQQKEITLENLFNQKSAYLQAIAKLVQEDLKKQYQQDGVGNQYDTFISQGTMVDKSNFEKFVLTNNAIVFIFDPGIVGPYVAGIRRVAIPYDELKNYFAMIK